MLSSLRSTTTTTRLLWRRGGSLSLTTTTTTATTRQVTAAATNIQWWPLGTTTRTLSTAAAATPPAAAATATASSNKKKQTSLYMWGTDSKGSLLKPATRADENMLDVPTRVPRWTDHIDPQESSAGAVSSQNAAADIARVVCGTTDTAILLRDGSCYVAGENKQGQLGMGHAQAVPKLKRVQLPVYPSEASQPRKIAAVALGPNHGAYIDNVGDLYTTGFGGSAFSGLGALGQGEGASCTTPIRVDSLVEDGCYAKQVCIGESHMTVLTTEGEVLTCGTGSYGRLGNFETVDQLYLEPVEILTQGVTYITGGKSFTLALTKEGVLYGWGRNHKGQLGTGLGLAVDMYAMQSVPEPIEADELLGRKVTHVAAGYSHAACITASGELFFWGMSLHLEPIRVDALLHTRVIDVACGQDYTLAVGEDGKLYSFGLGQKGVLGLGSVRRANQATWMEALDGKRVLQVSAGYKHAACLVEEDAPEDN